MSTYHRILPLILLLACSSISRAQQLGGNGKATVTDSKTDTTSFMTNLHTDVVYLEDGKLYEDIFLTSLKDGTAQLELSCYRYTTDQDSILLYNVKHKPLKIKKGSARYTIPFQGAASQMHIAPGFARLIRQTELFPAGSYKLYCFIRLQGAARPFEQVQLYEQDSLLDVSSSLRKGILRLLQPVSASGFFSSTGKAPGSALDKAGNVFERNSLRLERYFKKKGLTPRQYKDNGKEIIDLYYEGQFVRRYEVAEQASVTAEWNKEQSVLEDNLGSLAHNNLGDYRSLQSQFREMKKDSRENKELQGTFALSGNWSNDQEPGSQLSNQYYEARGNLEFPLFDIPVSVEGYYTTQDRHREAKSSFIHFRYDSEKAKEQLLKLIGSYNKRYEQTLAQGGSYNMIYSQMLGQLQAQKEQAITSLKQQLAMPDLDMAHMDEAQLKAAAEKEAKTMQDKLRDSLQDRAEQTDAAQGLNKNIQKAEQAKQKSEAAYAKALEQYQHIQALEQKIRKYQALLEQYRNTSYYDSLLAYSKIRDLKNMDQASYKDLAKKASGLLPDGKAKGLISGLTNFDAGIFPKYVSDYTLSGQMLKGADIGYDVGIATVGGSYGTTQYIDRDGHVEDYKAYSGRVQLKPVLGQAFGLIYYGYSPGRNLVNDNSFFKDVSASLPSFRNPVHILSATYNGEIGKLLALSGEFATANKPGQSGEAAGQISFTDRSAYNVKLDGTIPGTSIDIGAGYEHAGKSFENNTLPVIMAGTERIQVKGKGDFFRSFLSLGLEYNYLIQQSFYTQGHNTRWGFDVATHSKRYPSLSLSYKPFSTFRSYNDTLNIAQKPLLGEVWTGKASYQFKRLSRALRFTLMYSSNTSTMDTVHYGSTMLQFSTIYTFRTTMLSLNIGSSNIHTDYIATAYPAFNNSRFANISASGTLAPALTVSGGTDVATTDMGLSRYGLFAGGSYAFKKLPLMIRANFRYSNYRLDEVAGWKQLYSGSIELAWRLKVKLFDD